MKKALLSLFAAVALATPAMAQLPYNPAINTSGTYTPLLPTQGSPITTANFDDALSAPVALGFDFPFNDSLFTQFQLSTNGFIKLGDKPVSPDLFPTAGTNNSGSIFRRATTDSTIHNIIAGLNCDFQGNGSTAYRYHMTGVAPNRVGIIEFSEVSDKPIGTHPTIYSSLSFQIWLHENGNIQVMLGPFTPVNAASTTWRTFGLGLRAYRMGSLHIMRGRKQNATAWADMTFPTTAATPVDDINVRPANAPTAGTTVTFTYTGIIAGSKGLVAQRLRLYPNPASQAVTVPTAGQLSLFDAQGRQVIDQAAEAGQPVNIQHLPAGLYQVRLAAANGAMQLGRLVKE